MKKKKQAKMKNKKKKLIWGCIFPTSILAIGGTTVGVLAATTNLFTPRAVTNIASIFTDMTNPYQWSNNATTAGGTGTQDSTKDGSSTKPLQQKPSERTIIDNLHDFLDRSSQTSRLDVLNDLTIGNWTIVTGSLWNCNVSASSTSYTGNFTINIYLSLTHDLPSAITNHIIDYSSTDSPQTVSDVLTTLAANNTSLNAEPENIQIGYMSGGTFNPWALNYQMTQANLNNLWQSFSVDSTTGYAYGLTVHAVSGGYYDGSSNVSIYLKLKRITFNATTFFGSNPSLNNQGGNTPFYTAPNVDQASSAFVAYYSTSTNFGGSGSWANFYTSDTNNCTFALNTGKLQLTYGDTNQFYTSDGGTHPLFTLNVQNKTPLSDIFKSDDGTLTITNDTSTNNIEFISVPTQSNTSWINLQAKLKERYVNGYDGLNWNTFNGADFTSMEITNVVNNSGSIGNYGQLQISPIYNSLFYSGFVTISWCTYNYAP